MNGGGEFYVGYQRQAPPALGRFLRRTVGLLLALALVLGLTLACLQRPFDPGTFEYGVERQLSGVVWERPYPLLAVERPRARGTSLYHLVAFGKHGGGAEVAGLDGRRVRLAGSLIYRGGQTMVEIAPGSVEALDGGAPAAAGGRDLGTHTLVGEIVDSKCYLGVMKPGRGKPHRACAALCIRGGIPPLFAVATAAGEALHFLLVDEDGGAVNPRVVDRVGEPLAITGRVRRTGDLLVLAADPAAYEPIPPWSR